MAANLIAGGLLFAAKLGVSYLTRQKQRKYSAVQGEIQYGADVPAGTLYGTGMVKGHRAYYGKWGKGNKFNADVYILSNGWCDGLEEVYFYGENQPLVPVPVIGNETARFETAKFGNKLTIRFYDGRPGQGVDAKLVADTALIGRNWKSTSVCAGLCYVVVEREYDERFNKGAPDFSFVLRGLRLYDPRKDGTVVGGSGAHRIDNPATWEFSKNPAVQRFNYQLGLKGFISGRTLIGEGKSIGQLDLSSYFVSMNVCDTLRSTGKPTYQSALFVQGDDDHTEVLKEFDDAMAGYGLNRRGLSGVIPGAPQIPVLNIMATDIPVDRAQQVSKRKSAFEMYNMMSGQFTSPASQWKPESLKPIVVNNDIAIDGRRRQTSNDFLQVSDPDIAQYLLNIRYRQNRKGGQATVPVSRRVGLKVQEGEWVTFDGKTWLVTEWRCDENFLFTLVLSETGPDIYQEGGIDPGPIIIPPKPPVNPSELTTVQNFRVQVGMINGAQGFETPILRFTWDPPQDPTITAVRFVYRIQGTTVLFRDQTADVALGVYDTAKDVQSGVIYDAQATIVTVPDRFKTFTPWETTATATGKLSIAVELQKLQGDARNVLDGLIKDNAKLNDKIEKVARDALQGGGENVIDRQVFTEQFDSAFAQIVEEKRIRADETGALAEVTSAVKAQMDDPATGLKAVSSGLIQVSGRVDKTETGLSAVAEAMLGVQASLGPVTASGLISFQAQVPPPAGVLSQINILARATTSAAFVQSGFVIQVYDAGGGNIRSKILILADRLTIWDGTTQNLPFVVENGVAKLAIANIGDITAGTIRSPDNKFIMTIATGTFEWYD